MTARQDQLELFKRVKLVVENEGDATDLPACHRLWRTVSKKSDARLSHRGGMLFDVVGGGSQDIGEEGHRLEREKVRTRRT